MASTVGAESDASVVIIHNEESPLLDRTTRPLEPTSTQRTLSRQNVVTICLIVIVLVEIGAFLQTAPLNKLLEQIICSDYLSISRATGALPDIDDPRCKSAAVQGRLAVLRGWQASFDCIPGILTAIPYGLMSDKYGRRVVLFMALLGLTLGCAWYGMVCWWPDIFPVWLTWFSSAFSLMGGGGVVVTSMIYTIISDVVPDAERASIFFRLSAAVMIGEIIATPLSASLMEYNTWLPIFLGLGSLALGTWVSLFLPETLGHKALTLSEHEPTLRSSNPENPEEEISAQHNHHKWYTQASLISRIRSILKDIWKNKHIILLLFTFLVTTLGRFVQELLMQYITKKFQWSWSQAAYLLTFRAASNLVLLLVLLPVCSSLLLTKLSLSVETKDLWLARISCMLLIFGTLVIGFAMNAVILTLGLVLFSFGCGFNVFVRSLLTSLVEPHHVGTLYNTIAVTETVSMVFAGPLLSTSFQRGLDIGGAWIGLPFFIASGLFGIAAFIVFSVRLRKLPID